MPIIQIKNIGLAAYMRGQGAPLVGVVGRHFGFESDRPISEWKLAYLGSLEYRVDAQTQALKALLRNSG